MVFDADGTIRAIAVESSMEKLFENPMPLHSSVAVTRAFRSETHSIRESKVLQASIDRAQLYDRP